MAFVISSMPYLVDGMVRRALSAGLYSVLVTAILVVLGNFSPLSGTYQQTKGLCRGSAPG